MEDKGTAIYLCPACGAFISESATKCPHCGEALEGLAEEGPANPDEAEVEQEVNMLDLELAVAEEEAPEAEGEPVTLFICSVCGAFTGGSATKCPNCGASMVDEELEPGPAIKPGEPESDVLDMLVGLEPEESAPTASMADLKEMEGSEPLVELVEGLPYTDPDKAMVPGLDTERAPEGEDAIHGLEDLILESATSGEPAGQAEPAEAVGPGADSPEEGSGAEAADGFSRNETIALCQSCGAFISETANVCNVCGQRVSGDRKYVPAPEAELAHEEDDADAVLRTMLGVKEDAVLDNEAGTRFQSDGGIDLCTVCGAFIGREATQCSVCGTHIEDMPEFVPSMDVKTPDKVEHGLAICPNCGVFVQEGATECMSCVKPIPGGAKVEKGLEAPKADESDSAADALRSFLRVGKVLDMTPPREVTMSSLDICPDCGAFVSMNAVVCSICGSPLFEGAEELADLDMRLSAEGGAECPNCGTPLEAGASECPGCFMAFTDADLLPDSEAADASDIEGLALDEPPAAQASTPGPVMASHDEPPAPTTEGTMDEELESLIVSESLLDDLSFEEAPEPGPDAAQEESREPEELPQPAFQPEEQTFEAPEGSCALTPEVVQPGEPDVLEFVEETQPALAEASAETGVLGDADTLIDEPVEERAHAAAALPAFDSAQPSAPRSGNWATLIYVSAAAVCFFIVSYLMVPGDYAPGLAVIFGAFSGIGAVLAFTEKGTFFKGDARHSGVFFAGVAVAAATMLIAPLGAGSSGEGVLSQAGIASMLFSVAVLLVIVGMLWIRARVRYIFTWSGGAFLIFIGALLSTSYDVWPSGMMSPVLLVPGLGAGLVFIGLAFLLYERALNTSIESDIVRGDAHYLRRDYRKALASYDDALSKAQIRKVDVIGSPLVEYDVPWYSKGSALILMGEFEEGIKCLDMALAINPDNEVTWVNKGNAHTKLGEHDMAMECYSRAIECNPFYEVAWNNLGNAHARQKDYVEALRHYNRALKINPKYDDAWINKGYVLAKMGRRDAAVKCLEHVGSRAKGKPVQVDRDVHTL